MAAVTVGELNIVLDAVTKEFRREVAAAERRVEKLERQSDKSTRNISRNFRKMAKGAAVAGGAS